MSILTVVTPAVVTQLTTLEAVKRKLGITTDTDNEELSAEIDRMSALIVAYINTARDANGRATLGRETLLEQFRGCTDGAIILARTPVASITSVVEDGVTIDSDDYELDNASGTLWRLSGDVRCDWTGSKTLVTYVAGWLLPDEEGRTLPEDIESAALDLISGSVSSSDDDPTLRREEIPGVLTREWWVEQKGRQSIPTDVQEKLDPYREIRV